MNHAQIAEACIANPDLSVGQVAEQLGYRAISEADAQACVELMRAGLQGLVGFGRVDLARERAREVVERGNAAGWGLQPTPCLVPRRLEPGNPTEVLAYFPSAMAKTESPMRLIGGPEPAQRRTPRPGGNRRQRRQQRGRR